MVEPSANFTGSIPEYYDRCLGPAWFDAFAEDLVARVPPRPPGEVLEIACGTGLVTRRLRERLDPALGLVASDLSTAMLEYASRKLAGRGGIEWREADAAKLPFEDGRFGAVLCAFGFMFVPDKRAAFRETRRVLKPGGLLLFNVWDRIEHVPHAITIHRLLDELFPGDTEIQFNAPYEMYDPGQLRERLDEAGFVDPRIENKRVQIGGVSARQVATGVIRGTPRSLLIEKRGVSLDDMIEKLTAALAELGGADPFRAPASALVVQARAGA